MASTEQSKPRYEALERDLISGLEVERLMNLEAQCVEAARQLHLQFLADLSFCGKGFLVAFVLNFILPSWLVAIGVVILALRLVFQRDSATRGFGVRFLLSGGKTFSVHEWNCRPDNPTELRFWNEAKSRVHGTVDATVVKLTDLDRKAMMIADLGMTGFLTQTFGLWIAGGTFGLYFMTLLLKDKGGSWLLGIAGILLLIPALLQRLRGQILKAAVSKEDAEVSTEKLDPTRNCVGNSYSTIIQVLDSRGAPHGARRLR